MRLRNSALVLLLVMSIGAAGCVKSEKRNPYSQVPTNPQEYQRFIDTKRHYDNQTRKGKWAGQYKSGKPIRRIPTESYNGYRSLKRGIKRGY